MYKNWKLGAVATMEPTFINAALPYSEWSSDLTQSQSWCRIQCSYWHYLYFCWQLSRYLGSADLPITSQYLALNPSPDAEYIHQKDTPLTSADYIDTCLFTSHFLVSHINSTVWMGEAVTPLNPSPYSEYIYLTGTTQISTDIWIEILRNNATYEGVWIIG